MMNLRNKKKAPLEISLTPMIDVVFLLLIFFMVTTTFSQQTAIKVQLPQADGQPSENQKQMLLLSIDKSGQYFINDTALKDRTIEGLRVGLNAFSQNKMIPFVIHADASAPVQSAINVLDVAAKIGFRNITFATQKN